MSILNQRYASVNLSTTKIPVYEKLVPNGTFAGNVTVGGSIIGHIYQYEFYIVFPNSTYSITSFKILFRDANKQCRYGYIETCPNNFTGLYSWVEQQYQYNLYNSNGSKLVSSKTVSIDDKNYRVFTVTRPVSYRAPDGTLLGTILSGMELATLTAETGRTYNDYMVFHLKRNPASLWRRLNADYTYCFVDLDLKNGNMPYDRAIR